MTPPVTNVAIGLFTMTPALRTGTAPYARGLVEALCRRDDVDVDVLVNRLLAAEVRSWAVPPRGVEELRSIPVRDTPLSRLSIVAQALAAPGTLTRQLARTPDVVHFPLTLQMPRPACPRVVTYHDLQHHDRPAFFSRAQRAWRRRAYDRPATTAAHVITGSEHARRGIVERLGVPEARVTTIHHGIDHAIFRPDVDGDDVRLAHLPVPRRFVLYPAAMWRHKNHEALVDALALAADRELAVVLTGPTFGRLDVLLDRARRRGVADRVSHIGFVTAPQLAALYRRAVALVFPSLYEGFGVPPIEAMASGCPVVSSTAGPLGEVCGDAALTFEPTATEELAHALDRVAADDATRAALRARGLTRAARFTWERSAEAHLRVYARSVAAGSE